MDLQLQGKKAIVTGGSRGMGKAIARQLAREGCDVAIGSRTEGPLREAAAEITQETGRKIVPLVLDTLDAESIKRFVRGAAEALGNIHILVNSAARVGGTIPDNMDVISDAQIIKDFEEKFLGYFRCAREAAPYMKKAGWGAHYQSQRWCRTHSGYRCKHPSPQYRVRHANEISGEHARSFRYQRERYLPWHDP